VQPEKPHKGVIKNWIKLERTAGIGLGYMIFGDAPEPGYVIRTSPVVKHDEATGEIETTNSRYTLA
jgi:hypothetical protein